MYQVMIETRLQKNGKRAGVPDEFVYKELDTPEFEAVMDQVSDILYGLEMEWDVDQGDGDMLIDDILVMISEAEDFEQDLKAGKKIYHIKGENI